ncbi:MAG: MAPEG family protein [Beijerinckiaceae bacterium]|nr:MAPEG family protein [Beijerinckiaceae bacterium]
MTIVPVYAALLALGFVFLSVRVINVRRSSKVAIGTNGDAALERAMRVHANFAEYAPLALVLLLMMEMQGANAYWLNALCLALLAGRASHAFGVSSPSEDFRFRGAGMMMTFFVIVASSLSLLWLAMAGRV